MELNLVKGLASLFCRKKNAVQIMNFAILDFNLYYLPE